MKWEKLINLHFSLKLILTKGDNNNNNCTYKVSIIIIILRKWEVHTTKHWGQSWPNG